MSVQHYLITGGTGFIGRALCRQLAQQHRVTVVSRQARPTGLAESLGASRWTDTRKQEFSLSRLRCTQALIDWMQTCRRRPHTLINASAIGWYGHQGEKPLTELSDARAGFSHRLCDRWEKCALQAQRLGVRVCIVRMGIVLERDGGSLASMLLPFKLGLGGPMGSGRQQMSWIHRQDLL